MEREDLWDLSYLSWGSFREAVLSGKWDLWDRLVERDLLIGGIDFSFCRIWYLLLWMLPVLYKHDNLGRKDNRVAPPWRTVHLWKQDPGLWNPLGHLHFPRRRERPGQLSRIFLIDHVDSSNLSWPSFLKSVNLEGGRIIYKMCTTQKPGSPEE